MYEILFLTWIVLTALVTLCFALYCVYSTEVIDYVDQEQKNEAKFKTVYPDHQVKDKNEWYQHIANETKKL